MMEKASFIYEYCIGHSGLPFLDVLSNSFDILANTLLAPKHDRKFVLQNVTALVRRLVLEFGRNSHRAIWINDCQIGA